MEEAKPYWYHNTAYLMEPYFVCLHFLNLFILPVNMIQCRASQAKSSSFCTSKDAISQQVLGARYSLSGDPILDEVW